jgi:hypothetical protein
MGNLFHAKKYRYIILGKFLKVIAVREQSHFSQKVSVWTQLRNPDIYRYNLRRLYMGFNMLQSIKICLGEVPPVKYICLQKYIQKKKGRLPAHFHIGQK